MGDAYKEWSVNFPGWYAICINVLVFVYELSGVGQIPLYLVTQINLFALLNFFKI